MNLPSAVFLLLIGFPRPANVVELFVNGFVFFTYLNYFANEYLSKKQTILIAFVPTMIIAIWLLSTPYALSLLLSFTISFLVFPQLLKLINKKPVYLLFPIIISFIVITATGATKVVNKVKREPQPETYADDKIGFLRIFYQVEKGNNYYYSLQKTHIEDVRADTVPNDLFSWRLPTHAYLWNIIPLKGGTSIYLAFIILSVLLLFEAYKISSLFIKPVEATLSSYMLLPYLSFASTSIEFLQTDWWALFFFVPGYYFHLKNNRILASLLFFSSIATREIFAIPLIVLIIVEILVKKKTAVVHLILPLILLSILVAYHYTQVSQFTPLTIVTRGHEISTYILHKTLSYGSVKYLLVDYKPFTILVVVVTLITIVKRSPLFLTAPTLVPAALMLKFGASEHTDYWSILYIPLLLIIIPIVINFDKSYPHYKQS